MLFRVRRAAATVSEVQPDPKTFQGSTVWGPRWFIEFDDLAALVNWVRDLGEGVEVIICDNGVTLEIFDKGADKVFNA